MGKSGQGKSTFLGQILLNAVDSRDPVCAYSGELRADRFQYWINLQAAGRTNIIEYQDGKEGKPFGVIANETLSRIRDWYRGKFWLYDNSIVDNGEETSILKVFQYAAKRYGCKVFLVDNLMTSRFNVQKDGDFYRRRAILLANWFTSPKRSKPMCILWPIRKRPKAIWVRKILAA